MTSTIALLVGQLGECFRELLSWKRAQVGLVLLELVDSLVFGGSDSRLDKGTQTHLSS
jgi:hypothetical protein